MRSNVSVKTRGNVNVSITVTPKLKEVLDVIVGKDSHISYGDFFREAARDTIRRKYPRYARLLGLKPEEERPILSRGVDEASCEKGEGGTEKR